MWIIPRKKGKGYIGYIVVMCERNERHWLLPPEKVYVCGLGLPDKEAVLWKCQGGYIDGQFHQCCWTGVTDLWGRKIFLKKEDKNGKSENTQKSRRPARSNRTVYSIDEFDSFRKRS